MSNVNRNIITRAEFRDLILELAEEENKKHEDEYVKVPVEVAERRLKDWTTLYRRNMDIFVEDYLGIKLAPFQKIMLTQMAKNDIQVDVCSRGLSKSFVTGLFAIAYALLYPSVKILITARTLGQANLIIDEKIDKIFCSENTSWSSPILCQMRHDGYIDFSTDKESGGREVRIGFKGTNESVIYARGALESTRGIIKNKNIIIQIQERNE